MRAEDIKKSLQTYQRARIQLNADSLQLELERLEALWDRRADDPPALIGKLRLLTEELLELLCIHYRIPRESKGMTVDKYLQIINKNHSNVGLKLPPWFRGTVETLRNYGNSGAHRSEETLTEKDAVQAMNDILRLLGWMREELGILHIEDRARSWPLWGAVAAWPVAFALGALTYGVVAGVWSERAAVEAPLPAREAAPVVTQTTSPALPRVAEPAPSVPLVVEPAPRVADAEVAQVEPSEDGRVLIPAGRFWRGSERGEPRNKPMKPLTLSAFRIDRAEVTVQEYAACVEERRCAVPADHQGPEINWGKAGREDHPINGVSWDEARRFCQWRGGDLPTEAQWERAARGANDQRDYPWGSEAPSCERAMMSRCPSTSSGAVTAPVGARPAGRSPEGLEDMAGNVWEWTLDFHDDGFYARAPAVDPHARRAGKQLRVFRGGSFNRASDDLTVWRRRGKNQDESDHGLGFRCAYAP
jgi:sulfatase modifying factor 1